MSHVMEFLIAIALCIAITCAATGLVVSLVLAYNVMCDLRDVRRRHP